MKNIFNFFGKYKNLTTKFLFLVPFFFALVFVSSRFLGYFNLEFENPSSLGAFNREDSKSHPDKSILVLGVDKDENNNEFVDYLSIYTFGPRENTIKIFNINPKFSPYIQQNDEYVAFRSMLVFFQTYYPQDSYVDKYIQYIENVFTIKIDGYVIVTEEGFENISKIFNNINVTAPSELVDNDISGFSIKEGNNSVNHENILKFLSADANGDDDKLQRQLSTVQSLYNSINLTKLIFKQDILLTEARKNIKSNLTGRDLFKIFVEHKLKSSKFKVGYTSSEAAIRIEDELDERWYTVFSTLDKDVQKVYVNDLVKMEQANVDVFNSTNASGLARSKARALENKGFRVVLVGNTSEKFEKTTVFLNNQKDYSNTIDEIYNTLESDEIDIKNQKYDGRSVGDIVIILGDNEIN